MLKYISPPEQKIHKFNVSILLVYTQQTIVILLNLITKKIINTLQNLIHKDG